MKYLTRIYDIEHPHIGIKNISLLLSITAFKNPYNTMEIKDLCKRNRNTRFDILDFENKVTSTVTLDYIIDVIQNDDCIIGIIEGGLHTHLSTVPKHLIKIMELSYELKCSEYNGHIEEFLLDSCNDFEDVGLVECDNFDIVVCKDDKGLFGVVSYLESKNLFSNGFFYYNRAIICSVLDLYKIVLKSGNDFSNYTRLYFSSNNTILEIGLNSEVIRYVTKLITLER